MASFSDNFARADSTSLGAGWVEVSGDWSIVSQQLSSGNAGGTIILRAAGAMDTADHSVQVKIAATAAVSHGVWARGNSNITQGYLLRNDGTSWNIFSVVGGSFTSIGSYAVAAAANDIVKLEVVGSSIKGYINDVLRISVTNTAVTTGTSVGIRAESTSALRFDDFTAADVTAGATLGTSNSTETAQTLTGTKVGTLTPATEADAAQGLAGSKSVTLPPGTEQGTAQALAGAKTTPLTPAGETDAAQAPTGTKAAGLAPATEQDEAQAQTGAKTAAAGTATSTEPAQPLTGAKATTLTPATEGDTAQGVAGAKAATLGTATSVEEAQPLTAVTPAATLPTVGSEEAAQPLTGSKAATLNPTAEADAARPLAAPSTIESSPEQTFRIPAGRRQLTVPAGRRRFTVAAESRTLTVRR